MSLKKQTKLGYISIDDSVIATIAGFSAIECYGIIGMAALNVTDGFFDLLKKENLTKGINILYDKDDDFCDDIKIELHVIVAYGTNISAIGDTLIESVKYSVESSTGFHVSEVNIFVQGIKVLS